MAKQYLRLGDLEQDGHYMVINPSQRFGKVVGREEIETIRTSDDGVATIEQKSALVVHCTVPTVQIDGHVGAKAVRRNKNILEGLMASDDDSEYDHRVWVEVWAERPVGIVFQNKANAAEVSDSKFRPQVYCHEVRDLAGNVILGHGSDPKSIPLYSSGILNGEIKVIPVAAEKVHGDPFSFGKKKVAVA